MRLIITLILAIFCLNCVTSQSVAQLVPYKTRGTGIFNPLTGDYSGNGVGTHVGRHTFQGIVAVTPTANPLVFDFVIHPDNPQETIAADGSIIYFSGSGQVQLVPLDMTFTLFSAVWTGSFVVEGGTGRFEDVEPGPQPLDVEAINDPFTFLDPIWSFTWSLEGQIQLD